MLGAQDILMGGVIPAAIVLVLLLAERLLFGRNEAKRTSPIAALWPLVAAAGYLLGHLLQQGSAFLRPAQPRDWLPWLAVAGGVVSCMLLVRKTSRLVVTLPLMIAVIAAFEYLTMKFKFGRWSTTETVVWLVSLGAVTSAAWLLLNRPPFPHEPKSAPIKGIWDRAIALLVAMIGSALIMLMSGSQSYGEIGGTLIFIAMAMLVVARVTKSEELVPATLGGLIALLTSVLAMSHFYSSLTMINLVALLAALLLSCVPLPAASDWKRWAVRLLAVAIPVGVALTLAGMKFAEDMANPSPYG